MLTDPIEIEIISKARQANVRDPLRNRKPFETIFADFLHAVNLTGKSTIDLGPGQYDFCELARDRGVSECFAIDSDPAVVELGQHKQITVSESNLRDLAPPPFPKQKFDGVFCKYSFNCFWFHDSEKNHERFLHAINELTSSDGWAWLAPWNGVPEKIADQSSIIEATAEYQRQFFIDKGYTVYELTDEQSSTYGVHGGTYNRPIFTRNLPEVKGLDIISSR